MNRRDPRNRPAEDRPDRQEEQAVNREVNRMLADRPARSVHEEVQKSLRDAAAADPIAVADGAGDEVHLRDFVVVETFEEANAVDVARLGNAIPRPREGGGNLVIAIESGPNALVA